MLVCEFSFMVTKTIQNTEVFHLYLYSIYMLEDTIHYSLMCTESKFDMIISEIKGLPSLCVNILFLNKDKLHELLLK